MIKGIEFDSVSSMIQKEYLKEARKIPSKYVLGALYGEFEGKFYGFDKDFMSFNPCFVSFLMDHKRVYDKVDFYQWMLFIEKRLKKEREVMGIASRLDSSTKLRRSSLEKYKKEIYPIEGGFTCFYCGRKLSSCHLDHFIP